MFARELFAINKSIDQIVMLLSVCLFVHFVVKSLLEFMSEYFGLKINKIIKCLNNCIESMLLYSMILGTFIHNKGFILVPMLITNHQIQTQ